MEQDYLCISWKNLPWSVFRRKVFRLQCKIYEANKVSNFKLVKRLQKLLIHSNSSHFIATKFLVNGSKESHFSESESYILACSIRGILKEKLILDKLRLCESCNGLESGKIIIIQYILRLALEPIYYDKSSWFLLKRRENFLEITENVKSHIKRAYRFGWKKILRFEVRSFLLDTKCNLFIKRLSLPKTYKLFIYKALENGYFTTCTVKNGLVDFLTSLLTDSFNTFDHFFKNSTLFKKDLILDTFAFSYSNNIFYFIKQKANFYHVVDRLKVFLESQGLIINLSSISISTLEEGFDFFGWFFKVLRSRKISVFLSHYNWLLYKRLFKSILRSPYATEFKIRKMCSLHSEWFYKYRFVSKFILKTKFYFIKRSVLKYTKLLNLAEKKILFESFRFRIPGSICAKA